MLSSTADAAGFRRDHSFHVWNVVFAKTTNVFKRTSAAYYILEKCCICARRGVGDALLEDFVALAPFP
jgi:hypothetical protein